MLKANCPILRRIPAAGFHDQVNNPCEFPASRRLLDSANPIGLQQAIKFPSHDLLLITFLLGLTLIYFWKARQSAGSRINR